MATAAKNTNKQAAAQQKAAEKAALESQGQDSQEEDEPLGLRGSAQEQGQDQSAPAPEETAKRVFSKEQVAMVKEAAVAAFANDTNGPAIGMIAAKAATVANTLASNKSITDREGLATSLVAGAVVMAVVTNEHEFFAGKSTLESDAEFATKNIAKQIAYQQEVASKAPEPKWAQGNIAALEVFAKAIEGGAKDKDHKGVRALKALIDMDFKTRKFVSELQQSGLSGADKIAAADASSLLYALTGKKAEEIQNPGILLGNARNMLAVAVPLPAASSTNEEKDAYQYTLGKTVLGLEGKQQEKGKIPATVPVKLLGKNEGTYAAIKTAQENYKAAVSSNNARQAEFDAKNAAETAADIKALAGVVKANVDLFKELTPQIKETLSKGLAITKQNGEPMQFPFSIKKEETAQAFIESLNALAAGKPEADAAFEKFATRQGTRALIEALKA